MTCYAKTEQECWRRGGACSTHPKDPKWRDAVKYAQKLEVEQAELLAALRLYLDIYADTQTHPTPLQEGKVIMAVRAALAKAEERR